MSMIICDECGKEFSDKASSCPNCGCPIFNSTPIQQPYINQNPPTKSQNTTPKNLKKKNSVLSTWAAICAIFTCTSFIGFILGLIDLSKKDDTEKHTGSWFAIIFFAIMCVLSLITSTNNTENEDVGSTQIVTENNVNNNNENNAPQNTEKPIEIVETEEKIEVKLSETVVFDEKDVKIYVKSIEEQSKEYLVNFQIENNSSLNLGFNARSYSVNKIMTNNNIYDMGYDVAAGKKTVAQLKINKSVLEELNIKEVKNIDILIWAYDNDKHYKEFETNQIFIETNLDDGNYYIPAGASVYDKDGIKIDYINNYDGKYSFCINNNTGNYFDFDVENITINDYTSSDLDFDLIGVIVLNGCSSIFSIEPSEDFMKLNSIDKIERIEFNLEVRPLESYYSDFSTDVIKIEL